MSYPLMIDLLTLLLGYIAVAGPLAAWFVFRESRLLRQQFAPTPKGDA